MLSRRVWVRKETKESGGKAAEVDGDDEGMQNKVVELLLARARPPSFFVMHDIFIFTDDNLFGNRCKI